MCQLKTFLLSISFTIYIPYQTLGHPDGSPLEDCLNMFPKNDSYNARKFDPMIHEIRVTRLNSDTEDYSKNDNLNSEVYQVLLKTKSDQHSFRGFFIQARSTVAGNNQQVLGTWDTSPSSHLAKYSTCWVNNQASSVTHSDNSNKNRITLLWIPPEGFVGSVIFVATVVEDFSIFWSGIQSEKIAVGSASVKGSLSKGSGNIGLSGVSNSNGNQENQNPEFTDSGGLNTTKHNQSNSNSTLNDTKPLTVSSPKSTTLTRQSHKVVGSKGNPPKFSKNVNLAGQRSSANNLEITWIVYQLALGFTKIILKRAYP